ALRDLHSFPTRRSSDLRHMVDKSWQMAGGPGNWLYEFYDWLRRRLNHRITARLVNIGLSEPGIVVEAGSGTGFASTLMRDYTNRSEEHTSELQSRENLV